MNNGTHTNVSTGFLSGLRGIFGAQSGPVSYPEKPDEFHRLKDEFDTAVRALQQERKLRSEPQPSVEAISPRGVAEPARAADPQEAMRKAVERSKLRMRDEIENLHEELATGVDSSSLDHLQTFLRDIGAQLRAPNSADIEARLKRSALLVMVERSAEIAWRRLNTRMEAAGIEWPEPYYLMEGAPAEERAVESDRRLEEVRLLFSDASLESKSELVTGIVKAWTLSYPSEGSYLWIEVALRGVAAGIQASIVERVVETVRSDGESIRVEVSTLLKRELDTLNAAVRSHGSSVAEIDEMLRTAGEVLEQMVIERILVRAGPVFEEESAL